MLHKPPLFLIMSLLFINCYGLSEEEISSKCGTNEFTCNNQQCIPISKHCDNSNDCSDHSDEKHCELIHCQKPEYFRCKSERCISASFVCDGENDCGDFSDEEACEDFKVSIHGKSCEEDQWQCTDKLCIPKEWVCNGESECLDGSDEILGCSLNITCDGFKCDNHHCIPKEFLCDGQNDCHDNSDEVNCGWTSSPNECDTDVGNFFCRNNKTCITAHQVCDKKNDCGDNSDEAELCKVNCGNHKCFYKCVNFPTGPRCICPKGFRLINDSFCEDIDECRQYGICDQKCKNQLGSYECLCDSSYTLQADNKSCKADGNGTVMVFSTKNEIRAFLFKSEAYYSVAENLKQTVGVHFDGRHIYWTDIFAGHESIIRSDADGTHAEVLVTSGLGAPEDLDIDYVTGNIYFTDSEKHHIGVCTSNGGHCAVLINKQVDKPRGIVLNPMEGEMFWSDWGKAPEIARALMDGSNDTSFVSNDIHWPNGLALDHPNQRLYWTDAKLKSLESITLDGKDRRIVLQGVVKHPYAIAVFENKLYWSDWTTRSIQACDKFTGKNHHILVKEKDYIYGLEIFHPYHRERRTVNPCYASPCSDICLLKGTSSYTCACSENKELSVDGHTCREVEKNERIIVAANGVVFSIQHSILGRQKITTLPLLMTKVEALAYNEIHDILYVSDVETKKIFAFNFHTKNSEELMVGIVGKIVSMAYDYMGNNLYWCDAERSSVEVLNLDTKARKILIHDLHGETPESITLIPQEGVMFVAFQKRDKRESHVDRILMDGTGRTHSKDFGFVGPLTLSYDDYLQSVFIADAGTGNIETTSLEGHDRHGFRSLQSAPVGLASLRSDLFWVNKYSKNIYWANKLNLHEDVDQRITLGLSSGVEKMVVIAAKHSKVLPSPCNYSNGKCKHICLYAKNKAVCACPTGMVPVDDNNNICEEIKTCDANHFLCYKSNTCTSQQNLCNGVKNCPHNEDEEHCQTLQKNCSESEFTCRNGKCIPYSLKCNSHYDCIDKSDEIGCTETSECPSDHFRCNDGKCIDGNFLCDGVSDCHEAEDEANCIAATCSEQQFRCLSGSCIPKSWECDSDYDCVDLSDEHNNCAKCPPEMFVCNNKKCLDRTFVCDKEDDCGDNSDELNCEHKTSSCTDNQFACSSNTSICLPLEARCNGTFECPHREDEKDCSDCHVEEFACKNKLCIPPQWICDGTNDCGDNSDEEHSLCADSKDQNFTANEPGTSCNNSFQCKNGQCIDFTLVCNGKPDCFDDSDENGLCQQACDTTNNPCTQVCVATPSGPTCKCKPGFQLKGDHKECEDIDECQIDPPVCSQLCHNLEGSHYCDCYEGYILKSDRYSCKADGEALSILVANDNNIREVSQSEHSLKLIYSGQVPKISGIDSNWEFIFFTTEDSGNLHRLNRKTLTLESIENLGQPQKVAVDWITQNIYYFNNELNSKSIGVCNFGNKSAKYQLITLDHNAQVSSLAVDAINEVIFYATVNWWMYSTPSYVVFKASLDGTQKQELVKSSAGYVSGLAYDLHKKILFFADRHGGQLRKTDYDGFSNTILTSNLTRLQSLDFFEGFLYTFAQGGMMVKCRLYGIINCAYHNIGSFTDELFVIAQKSKQPMQSNCCQNHNCTNVCLPLPEGYKCICPIQAGKFTVCGEYKVLPVNQNMDRVLTSAQFEETSSTASTVLLTTGVVVVIMFFVGTLYYIRTKRHNSGSFIINPYNIRFYNPTYNLHAEDLDTKAILIPGQNE